ncbi:Metallo-dependent phosphatase-like protein [Cytidiella melzeri]|nr:Metallo-dependent phosphatase-like protein [Cytidiella melzeri]
MDWPPASPRQRLTGCGLCSYILLTTFIATFLLLGLSDSSIHHGLRGTIPKFDFPDFDSLPSFYKELPESDVNLYDGKSRFIFIGDVHGMNESLHDLLTKLSWDPSHDTIFFAGDLLAKSTHPTSLSVWDFIYTNHLDTQGRQVIYPVRGNHDQMVVQWRAWRIWFERLTYSSQRRHWRMFSPLPFSSFLNRLITTSSKDDSDAAPIHTGRDFLNLVEAEWVIATSSPGTSAPDPEEYVDIARKRARGTWREAWWARIPEAPEHGHDKKNWKMFTDHYWLARDMEDEQAEWLMKEVPLVNWVRSLHAFVAHAGVLPGDPTLDMDDRRQPLARVPREVGEGRVRGEDGKKFPVRSQGQRPLRLSKPTSLNASAGMDIPSLRRLQEQAILTRVPQNTDPWVVLNMRSVMDDGDVTRKMDEGTPWSDLWADAMRRCKGFGILGENELYSASGEDLEEEETDGDDGKSESHTFKKHKLRCYPSTVVYGHAATRGLDVKRWSFGLDTGCLYGRRLTALVLSRKNSANDEDEREEEEEMFKSMKFGDADARIKARLVSVECPNLEDEDA